MGVVDRAVSEMTGRVAGLAGQAQARRKIPEHGEMYSRFTTKLITRSL